MKTTNSEKEEILNVWKTQRRECVDEIDLSFAVMASIRSLVPLSESATFTSSNWLDAPSVLAGLFRASLTLFIILIPA